MVRLDAYYWRSPDNMIDNNSWLEKTISELTRLEQIEKEKPTKLSITSDEDIPDSFSAYKSVHISYRYENNQVRSLVERILDENPFINQLFLTAPISWSDLCSLNLNNLEELVICVGGELTSEKIELHGIKNLKIHGDGTVLRGELMDFSLIHGLEKLSIHRMKGFNAQSITSQEGLKKLDLQEVGISSLEWLAETQYSLEELCILDSIFDCRGIEKQINLERLTLGPCVMMDATPIAGLNNLRHVDLRRGTIIGGEEELRNLNIDELIINQHDIDMMSIKRSVTDLPRWSALYINAQNKQLKDGEYIAKLNPFQKKRMLRLMDISIEKRIQETIEQEYKWHIQRIKESDNEMLASISNDEYLKLFIKESIMLYPFLSTKAQS